MVEVLIRILQFLVTFCLPQGVVRHVLGMKCVQLPAHAHAGLQPLVVVGDFVYLLLLSLVPQHVANWKCAPLAVYVNVGIHPLGMPVALVYLLPLSSVPHHVAKVNCVQLAVHVNVGLHQRETALETVHLLQVCAITTSSIVYHIIRQYNRYDKMKMDLAATKI